MRDPYATLGVRRNAGAEEIKAAFRNLAKTVHPDVNPDDPTAAARFAEIGRAYEVLRDPTLRNRYDEARRAADLRRMEEMKRRMGFKEQTVDAETAEEAVSRIFASESRVRARAAGGGAAQPRHHAPAPEPERATASPQYQQGPATAQEAGPQPASVHAFNQQQQQQSGSQASRRSEPEVKTDAEFPAGEADAGDGERGTIGGLMRRLREGLQKPKPAGQPKAPDLFATVEVTIAEIMRREKVDVPLPEDRVARVTLVPGTTDGSVLQLKEQGYRLPGHLPGDLVVYIRAMDDPRFEIDGYDLRTEVPIALGDAVLGCKLTVPTLSGDKVLTVQPWTGPDKPFRLAGQGLDDGHGRRGDLVVTLRLSLGDKPDERLIDLMRSQKNGLVL
ncbi:hypothetical protein BJF92_03375 [Rhizobium rhizosphaerae]|uniref:J domain-containing protein n=1 Tax=Xaviernesmea rhizosphaerae TaxID=1672749 RepID=A0A1Q9AH73_9HYPH|nr:DnaJ C-terminal domain-containing protein [Xaviernesmea rhizosphaerae]OLP54464.1 hypothetical protein BJF92_03375 [Xaviernesmea rhizosphaerae]